MKVRFTADRLLEVKKYITKLYKRCFNRDIIVTLRNGYLNFREPSLWITTSKEYIIFFRIIRRAIARYPEISKEIAADAILIIEDRGGTFDCFMKGYLLGVLERNEDINI